MTGRLRHYLSRVKYLDIYWREVDLVCTPPQGWKGNILVSDIPIFDRAYPDAAILRDAALWEGLGYQTLRLEHLEPAAIERGEGKYLFHDGLRKAKFRNGCLRQVLLDELQVSANSRTIGGQPPWWWSNSFSVRYSKPRLLKK